MTYENELERLHQVIIKRALEVCENAAYLPDGNAQVFTELADNLGQAMVDLQEYEATKYAPWLKGEQQGLNSVQVSLQRLTMPEDQLKIERLIDAADRLYLAIFDEVVIPGYIYRIGTAGEMCYLPQEKIEEFLNFHRACVPYES